MPAFQIQITSHKPPRSPPTRYFLQQCNVLLFVPTLQLCVLVLAILQLKANSNHDVLLALVFYFLQVAKAVTFPLLEQIVISPVHKDLLHSIPLSLRLHRCRSKLHIRFACKVFELVKVVDSHPLRLFLAPGLALEVGCTVPEAILAKWETKAIWPVFVLVP
jgi:hypothetical protein